MKIHLIAIGGAIMHQLAISLKQKGNEVSGSDDIINEPSYSNLKSNGLLPKSIGFSADNLDIDTDVVILGMHAKIDNPELVKAMEKNLKVYSFPEYVYEMSKNKTRIVVAGSHGKTTITSMIMHVFKDLKIDFDYLVGSSVKGFENSVRLSDAPIIILEGDEYLSSCINKEPKFIYYKANYAILSGIELDHVNVFPTEEEYCLQYKKLINSVEKDAKIYYFDNDYIFNTIKDIREDIDLISYNANNYFNEEGNFGFLVNDKKIFFNVFGSHNMQNIEASKKICNNFGISELDFYNSIASFSGAGKRMEKIIDTDNFTLIRDFAHSPSKLRATVNAVTEKYIDRNIIAAYELHTFSSLTKDFLKNYKNTFPKSVTPVVFIDEKVVANKGNEVFQEAEIHEAFNNKDIKLFTTKEDIKNYLNSLKSINPVFLMMSSGTFAGLDFNEIGNNKSSYFSDTKIENDSNEEILFSKKISNGVLSLNINEKNNIYILLFLSIFFTILPPIFGLIFYINNNNITSFFRKFFNFQFIVFSIKLFIIFTFTITLGLTSPILLILFLYNIFIIYNIYKDIKEDKEVTIPKGINFLSI